MDSGLTGTRVRTRRLDIGLRQIDLAEQAGISASYLNLIEHNRRRIGGKLLTALAQALGVDPTELSHGAASGLVRDLSEVAGQARGQSPAPEADRAVEVADRFPGWAAHLVAQHRRIGALERRILHLSDRMTHDPELSGAVHDILSSVTAIRSSSTILTGDQSPDPAWQARFLRNIHEESARLAAASQALARALDLEPAADAQTDPRTPQETLEDWLADRDWHLPEVEAGEEAALERLQTKLAGAPPQLRAGALGWIALARADARALPSDKLHAACADGWPDPAALAQTSGATMAATLRRLATLPPGKAPGPVGLILADSAGALILRRALGGFTLPRTGAACPLWPLFEAAQRPDQPIRALVEFAGPPPRRFLTYAAAEPIAPGGYDRAAVLRLTMLMLPHDGPVSAPARPIGGACAICPRMACAARREPSLLVT